ncbi:hypothetical protein FQA39_LY17121 [Lamprigera yunnana]|nr:hypothetical protein FQA39_LY17121 [Lamprigera yunnana]
MKQINVFLVLLFIPLCYFQFLKDYGDSCEHSDECYDARMICILNEKSQLRCTCDRFHIWNGSTSGGCIPVFSVEYIMNHTVVVHAVEYKIEREQEFMFLGPMYSGYFMITVFVVTVVAILIFCCYVHYKDHREEHSPEDPITPFRRI